MHDDYKLKLAREALEWIDYHKDNQDMSHLDFRIGAGNQASESLAAINALDPQLVEAVGLLREVCDMQEAFEGEGITTVRLEIKCRKIRAFLAKQGDA